MVVVLGVSACVLALLLVVGLVVGPHRPKVSRARLDPSAGPGDPGVSRAVGDVTALAERLLNRAGRSGAWETALERAGISARPADVLIIAAAATVAVGALGLVLGGIPMAAALAVLAPLVARLVVARRRQKRQDAFAEQLDDVLQLMASSLRAGHSVLRAVDAVSHDTEAPASVEFARVVNETRVGRDVNRALEEVADRTGNEEFGWVVQAIAIHREVGGNLAEVLDRVSGTIRERTQIRRHARALSAEGRMSGIVLIAMPFVVFLLLAVIAPGYVETLTGTGTGRTLMLVSAALLTVGGLWLRSTVKVKF